MAAYRGELEVVVTSAEPLDSKSLNRLDKALKGTEIAQGKTLKVVNRVGRCVRALAGMRVLIHSQVNDSVLGGLLVDFGDKTSECR